MTEICDHHTGLWVSSVRSFTPTNPSTKLHSDGMGMVALILISHGFLYKSNERATARLICQSDCNQINGHPRAAASLLFVNHRSRQ